MERRPLYRDAEPLYLALARLTVRARSDEEWVYVRDRFSDIVDLYESIVRAGHVLGCKLGGPLSYLVRRASEAAGLGASEAMKRILEFEEEAKPLAARAEVAANYAMIARLVVGILLLVAGAAALASSAGVLAALAAALEMASGLSAVLLSRSMYGHYAMIAGIVPAALLALEGSTASLAAVAGVGLAAPLPAALKRLMIGDPGGC